MTEDKKYTQLLFILLISAFAISAYNFHKKENLLRLSFSSMLLIAFIITLLCLIYIPDSASAGMMSDRFCLMLFFVFLAALLSFPIPKKIVVVVIFCSISLQFSLYYYNHKNFINRYSDHAEKIFAISDKIQAKSVVLPINFSEDWIEGHFSNYLAINKELLILENYEASVGWFPLKWKVNDLPKFLLGTKQSFDYLYWTTNTESEKEEIIDYVFIYGNTSKLDQPEFASLKSELLSNYVLDESITDSYLTLYKLK